MAKITLIKQLNNTFKLAYDSDYETAKKIKVGQEYEYEFKRPRNYRFHRKYFALLNMVFQNQERYNNTDDLRKDLTIASGYYTTRFNFEGVEVYEAKSISFASMDEIEFNEFYNACIDTIVKHFHWDRNDIIQNIEQFF